MAIRAITGVLMAGTALWFWPERQPGTALESPHPAQRCEAALEAGRQRAIPAIPKLIALLQDDSEAIGPGERLLQSAMFGGRTRRVSDCAASALEGLGVAATPALTSAARSAEPGTRQKLFRILSVSRDSHAGAFLAEYLADADARIREFALTGVVQTGQPEREQAIRQALRDRDMHVRLLALGYAAEGTDEWVLPALLQAAGDESAEVRSLAVDRLGMRGDPRVVAVLQDRLKDQDSGVQQRARASLQRLAEQK